MECRLTKPPTAPAGQRQPAHNQIENMTPEENTRITNLENSFLIFRGQLSLVIAKLQLNFSSLVKAFFASTPEDVSALRAKVLELPGIDETERRNLLAALTRLDSRREQGEAMLVSLQDSEKNFLATIAICEDKLKEFRSDILPPPAA